MEISTLSFAYVLLVVLLFYILRKELRGTVLCLASIFYAFLVSNITGIVLVILAILVYLLGILLDSAKNKAVFARILSILAIASIGCSLLYFKYIKNTLLAVGYSFYCFQAISYIADIYLNKTKAIKNPLTLFTYFAWFPKLVSGPIERANSFGSQIARLKEVSLMDKGRVQKAVTYIFVGCFYKLVVADRISPLVNRVFDAPHIYQSMVLIMAVFLYTIQIYCDFAGYSMIAIGISVLFGIDLKENFCSPYLSTNITDFWKRWHISLTDWLRDYIYIPMGGNRKGTTRQYVNLLIVFLISGIWHGNGAGFLIWASLHGIFSVIYRLWIKIWSSYVRIETKSFNIISKCIGWIITFSFTAFAWLFFKAASFENVKAFLEALRANNRSFSLEAQLTQLEVNYTELIIAAIALIIIFIMDIGIKRYGSLWLSLSKISLNKWCVIMWFIIVCVVIFGIYGPTFDTGRMIYMQF